MKPPAITRRSPSPTQSSLLFLIDDRHRRAHRAQAHRCRARPSRNGLWQAGRQSYSTADLVGILDAEPERISPSALLRPVFQDFLLSTSLIIGGPAEIAYFAQSAVLYERILGRQTPAQPRFFGTLIEPPLPSCCERHELSLEQVFAEDAASLAQRLAARAMPIETKQKLAAAGNALDAELTTLVEWMQVAGQGPGPVGRNRGGQDALPDEPAAHPRRQLPVAERGLAHPPCRDASARRSSRTAILQERRPRRGLLPCRVTDSNWPRPSQPKPQNTCPGHTAIWL